MAKRRDRRLRTKRLHPPQRRLSKRTARPGSIPYTWFLRHDNASDSNVAYLGLCDSLSQRLCDSNLDRLFAQPE